MSKKLRGAFASKISVVIKTNQGQMVNRSLGARRVAKPHKPEIEWPPRIEPIIGITATSEPVEVARIKAPNGDTVIRKRRK